jgi:hypothetical protein
MGKKYKGCNGELVEVNKKPDMIPEKNLEEV